MSLSVRILAVVACFVTLAVAKDVSREKRDDANPVIVTTILEAPYLEENEGHDITGNDRYKGIIKEMMEQISAKLSLDYSFKPVSDNKYGSLVNGQWNGMIGEMLSNSADMAAAPMTISDERKAVVSFTEPFEKFGTVLLMLKGKDDSITKVTDLADQDEISYGIIKDGVTQSYFKKSTDAAHQKMWNEMQSKNNLMSSVEEGVTKVRNSEGKFAFILESATAEYWVDRAPCKLEIVGKVPSDDEKLNSFAFAVKKEDENLERINEVIREMRDSGELMRLRKEFKKGTCGNTIEDDSNTAASQHQITSMVILAMAYCLIVIAVL